jgi:hypothetical protein
VEWLIGAIVLLGAYGISKYAKGGIPNFLSLTPAGNAPPQLDLADQVAQSGAAHTAALALYGYLRVHGYDGSPTLANLVAAFQSTHNTDSNAVELTGPLPVSGIVDAQTSAALTIYTHDPLPPQTPPTPAPALTQAQVVNMSVPGSAETSGFNLYTYLKAHGNDRSAALHAFVQQFQLDVDTDAKYPGPANKTGLPSVITAPLAQTGVYDAPTAAALTVVSNDPIRV